MYDLLLISPQNTQLGKFKRFVPRSVPIGLGIIAGYLRKNGISSKILDQELVNITADTLREHLEQCSKPRIVGISAMTANVAGGYKIASLVRSIDKEAKIVFGGIHATVMPDEILQQETVDFVVKGEGEYTFLELVKQIKAGKIEPDKLESIGYRQGDKFFYTKPAEKMVDVDEVPMFPYDMFDPKHYNLGFILTSRGCPFDCVFCSQRVITKRKYRYVNSARVIEELDFLVNELHQPNITFFDDFFTGHKQRVYELCDMIKERGLHKKASFGVQTRGDTVDRELLKTMREANFNSLMFGVETASEELMKVINKKETVQQNIDAIKLAKELGFAVEATFIYGFPGETFEDRIGALSLAIKTGLDRARFNNATPYPGTQLFEMLKDELNIHPNWTNFSSAGAVTAGLKKSSSLPYVPKGATEAELEGSILMANMLFYLNFGNLKKLFNAKQSGSGKWFEVAQKDLLSPGVLFDLFTLGTTVFLRTLYYLMADSNCRRFFAAGLKA